MIAYYVILLLFLALGQGDLSLAHTKEGCSSSQDIQSAIDELSSQLNAVVDKHACSYRTRDSDVVSSSLLQLVLLQHVINGYGYNANYGSGSSRDDASAILERLDGINSSIKTSVEEAIANERANISSVINDLRDEVQQSTDVIMTLLEVVDSSRQAIETLTAIVTHLNNSVVQLQQCLDSHDKCTTITCFESCEQIRSAHPDFPSGYYNITVNGTCSRAYCNMCGTDSWTRVAYLNMSDSQQQCPSTLQLYEVNGVRVCRRKTYYGGCRTVGSFSSNNVNYTEICGRIIGYQYYRPDAFESGDIDGVYADGISLTFGSPRQHIWTFIASQTENSNCRCSNPSQAATGIGNHYYCESGYSGSRNSLSQILYTSDPLWDGEDCNGNETPCCSSPQFTPPWFHRVLDMPTSDDIDMRICFDSSDEDSPLELYEIYIK